MFTRPLDSLYNEASKVMTYHIVEHLNYDFIVFSSWYDPDKKNVHRIKVEAPNDLFLPLKLKIMLFFEILKNKDSFDIIHSFFTPTYSNSFFMRLLKIVLKKRIVQSIPTDITHKRFKRFLLYGDSIVVYSKRSRSLIKKCTSKKVSKILPAVDMNKFKPRIDSKDIKQKLGIKKEFIILFPGGYKKSSDCSDDLIDIISTLEKKNIDFKFIFACRISGKEDTKEEKRVKRIIKERKLSNRVIFLNEIGNMAKLISLSSVVVYPARKMEKKAEIPMVLLEAMSAEKPIIITDKPPLNEIVPKSKELVFAVGDTKAMSKRIVELYNSRKERRREGKKMREIIKKRYRLQTTLRDYDRLYRDEKKWM